MKKEGEARVEDLYFLGLFKLKVTINLIQTNIRKKKIIVSCHPFFLMKGWFQAWLEQGFQIMLLRISFCKSSSGCMSIAIISLSISFAVLALLPISQEEVP